MTATPLLGRLCSVPRGHEGFRRRPAEEQCWHGLGDPWSPGNCLKAEEPCVLKVPKVTMKKKKKKREEEERKPNLLEALDY